MSFPIERPRRLRRTPALRALSRQARLAAAQLVEPVFVVPGSRQRQEIAAMPGQFRLSADELVEECRRSQELGIGAVLLFGLPERKGPQGDEGYSRDGVVPRAIAALRRALPELCVIADVCLCEYTDHGHCGVLEGGALRNDPTLALLAKEAVAYADAGADIVAPSAMADGQVAAIRAALDRAGHSEVPILSYAAKFASAFYGPFREAAGSAPAFGDRRSYQLDPANGREALREAALDLAEGADLVMVKPALAYLDILRQVAERSPVPVAAYNVSGEYSMVKAAAHAGWIDEGRAVREILTAIRRAGADLIISYHARDAARWLREGSFEL
jgi:porphobilinogen synthase